MTRKKAPLLAEGLKNVCDIDLQKNGLVLLKFFVEW
jgi:hypothetical protein